MNSKRSASAEGVEGERWFIDDFNWFSIWIRYAFKLIHIPFDTRKSVENARANGNELKNHFNEQQRAYHFESGWSMAALPFHFYLENGISKQRTKFQQPNQKSKMKREKTQQRKKWSFHFSWMCIETNEWLKERYACAYIFFVVYIGSAREEKTTNPIQADI